ncbi:MAG: InlB B-repeat-containing protein [Clostridiales bacterium]|nr:InlB B-repeat-containing protein [Clostridiales bacterium]
MKRFYKLLCALFAAICAIGVATVFVACSETTDNPPPTPKEYTITLMLNEEQVWDTFTGKAGDEVKFEKGLPSRNNYEMKGWSATLNGAAAQLPTVMPESDQTYYAVFVRYYNLTLRAGAGTLAGDGNIRAEEGQSLYSLVKDVAPTAPGSSKFDGWYYGNKKIDAQTSDTVTGTLTLDARYTVDYTINIFKQNDYKSDDYTKVETDTVEKSGFIGSSPRDSEYPSYPGFEFDEQKSGATSDFVLSATEKNVFNAYYNLQAYRLVFNPNTPQGLTVSGSMGAAEWGYNVENTIPDCDFSITGYRFSHWSSTADGGDRLEVGDKYKITDSTTLYAVWTRGYADITGRSYDYIYVVENNDGSTVAYLDRYYLDELEGTYDKTTNTVSFKENGKVILRGKLDTKGYTFAYINTQAYVLHALGLSNEDLSGTIDESVTLILSDNGSAVYSKDGVKVNGTYALDGEQQSMKFTADDGDSTFYFRLSRQLTAGGNVDVFEIRSDAEVGEWCRLTDNYGGGSDYADDCYVLELNGYGEAVMHAKSGINSSARDYDGYYRYSAGAPEGRLEIYTVFVTSYDSDISRVVLVDRTATAAEDAKYKKFYKPWEFATTAYAKPADGEELDIETADSVVLDGYGLFDDSAKYTHGGETVNGKYTLNYTNRTLEFGGTKYFVDIQTVGEGDDARSYLVYEPMQNKDEFDKLYAISGIENSYRPGATYGFRFFNDNVAVLYVAMPDINRAFNMLNVSLQPVIEGTYTSLGGGEYLFQADIPAEAVLLIQYYYINFFGNQVGLNISNFGDFKFKLNGATTGEVSALSDGYIGIEVVENGVTYVTDGYGKAKFTNAQGIVTEERDYVILNRGLPCLVLRWTAEEIDVNGKKVEVSKQQTYTLIDGEFRECIDEYGKHNTQYSAQIPDTTFRLVVYKGDYATLAYDNAATRQITMYSWGKVVWVDGEKRFGVYEESGIVGNTEIILRDLYGDFKFGLKEVTVKSSDGKETTATRLFTYDSPASDVIDGKFVINGKDGATLAVDLTKGEAEYAVPNADGGKTTVSGEFKLRENVLTIVYTVKGEGEDENTYIRSNAFKLIYENNVLTSFMPVGAETGTWNDATGVNGRLLLSGEASSVDGEYIGTWYGYDRDTDSISAIDGTYARTDNTEVIEYVFKYKVEPNESIEGDDGSRSFNFAVGYDASRMPIYRIYSIPVYVVLYGSLTSTMPSYMLRGGGYTDLTLVDTYNNSTVGQLLIYPGANLLIKDAVLYAFGTNEIEPRPLLFFTIIGEGENMRGIILDGTFAAENFGRFECEGDGKVLTVPVLKDAESEKYEDEKIVVDRIYFNGLGTAMLIDTKNERSLPVMYLRYNTNTYALVSVSGDSIRIIALFRLYTGTREVEGDDGETTTETQYLVRFDDAAIRQTFKGEGHTAFVTDGFASATYADERGELHVCTFARLDEHPEVVVVTYLNGLQIEYMFVEVDTDKGTFKVLPADDDRIHAESEQGE